MFDDDPSGIVQVFQSAEDGGEIHRPLAEFREDALADHLLVVPALDGRDGDDIRIEVLEVDVPDAVEVPAEPLHRVAATEGVVARVEAEADQVRVRAVEEGNDFFRRLDVGCAVVVDCLLYTSPSPRD